MTVVVYRLEDEEYEEVARVEGGEVVEGRENIPKTAEVIDGLDDEEILDRLDGPEVIAAEIPEEAVGKSSFSEERVLYHVTKGEYNDSVFSTDGDPSHDAEYTYDFLDDLVDAGADVWQVRNGELHVWPEDKSSFPIHDPKIHVIGIPDEEAKEIYEQYPEVDFMSTPEVEKLAPSEEAGEGHVFGPDEGHGLDSEECHCEEADKVFNQFDECDYDDQDRRLCPYCGTQLQEYDKLFQLSDSKPEVIDLYDQLSGNTEKDRVYVDDPSEAPEDVEVQEGDQGGLYYETEGESTRQVEIDVGSHPNVDSEDVEEAESAISDLNDAFEVDVTEGLDVIQFGASDSDIEEYVPEGSTPQTFFSGAGVHVIGDDVAGLVHELAHNIEAVMGLSERSPTYSTGYIKNYRFPNMEYDVMTDTEYDPVSMDDVNEALYQGDSEFEERVNELFLDAWERRLEEEWEPDEPYMMLNAQEWWATAVEQMFEDPEHLESERPDTYEFLQEVMQ